MHNPTPSLPRVTLAIATIALSLAALTGCVGGTSPGAATPGATGAAASPSTSASPASPSQSATSSTAPKSPSPSANAPTERPIPVSATCDQLVSRQVMYDFNPNFGLQSAYTPKPGSAAARAVALKGVACSWLNQTSRDTIELSVAHLPADDITSRKATLHATSSAVGDFGPSGFFTMSGDVGVAEAFHGTYWVVARSTFFSEPAEAAQIVNPAIANLR